MGAAAATRPVWSRRYVEQLGRNSRPNISDVNRYGLRVDHQISSKDTLWVSMNYSKGSPYFVAQGYAPRYGSWEDGGYSTQNASITYVHTFSPGVLNEARFGYLRHASVRPGNE